MYTIYKFQNAITLTKEQLKLSIIILKKIINKTYKIQADTGNNWHIIKDLCPAVGCDRVTVIQGNHILFYE